MQYANRTFYSCDGEVGEEEIINALEDYGFSLLIGLPSVGKTTSSEFIARKLSAEGWKVIRIIPDKDLKDEPFKFKSELNGGCIFNIRLSISYLDGKEKVLGLAVALTKIFKKDFVKDEGKFGKVLKKIGKTLKNRLPVIKKSSVEKAHEMTLLAQRVIDLSGELAEHIEGFVHEFAPNRVYIERVGESILEVLSLPISYSKVGLALILVLTGLWKLKKGKEENIWEIAEELRKGLEKVDEKVLIVIDDFEDVRNKEVMREFVEICYKCGMRIFVVQRIGFEDSFEILKKPNVWSFVNVFRHGEVSDRCEDLWDLNVKELKRCVFFLMNAKLEEFKEIVEIHRDFVDRARKMNDLEPLKDEEIEEWWKKTAGIPYTALVLMRFKRVEEIKVGRDYQYVSGRDISELTEEEAEWIFNRILNGYYEVYRTILDEKPHLIPIILQDVAEDELEKFFENEKKLKNVNLLLLKHESFVESYEEDREHSRVRVYRLGSFDLKLREIFNTLAIHYEEVREDIIEFREILLDVMTKEREKTKGFTDRMLWFALEHVEWLKDNGVYRLKEALFWGRVALTAMPARGFEFVGVVEELWDNVKHDEELLLYASAYTWQLVEFGLSIPDTSVYLWFVKLAEKLVEEETDDDVILCRRAMTYSSIAFGLSRFGLVEYEDYLKKAEGIIEKIRSKSIANIAYLFLHRYRAMIGEEPVENLEKAERYLKEIEREGLTEEIRRYLKPLGGELGEMYKYQLREWYRTIRLELGRAYMNEDELKEAKMYFEKTLDYSREISDKLACKSRLGRIRVIEGYEFRWNVKGGEVTFNDLWNICRENLIRLTPELVAGICAEYLVSEVVNGRGEIDENDLNYVKKLYPDAFSILSGILYLFESIDKREALNELKNLDLKWFESKISDATNRGEYGKAVALEEVKMHVEELYDSAVNPLKKREFDLRKKIEIEVGKKGYQVWQVTFDSRQTLARIMMFYITKDLEFAKKLAEHVSSATNIKLHNRLFKELAEAIEREMNGDENARDDVKKAFVKFFYLHV
ncbi:hypothetical protein [Archaeoglobus sp.]